MAYPTLTDYKRMLNESKWLLTESYKTPDIHLPQILFIDVLDTGFRMPDSFQEPSGSKYPESSIILQTTF